MANLRFERFQLEDGSVRFNAYDGDNLVADARYIMRGINAEVHHTVYSNKLPNIRQLKKFWEVMRQDMRQAGATRIVAIAQYEKMNDTTLKYWHFMGFRFFTAVMEA